MSKKKGRIRYAPEFRRQMVELVRSGRAPEELAREFEPTAQAIRNWVAQSGRDAGMRDDGLKTKERDEISRLTDLCRQSTLALQKQLEHEENGDAAKHAKFFRDKVVPAMEALREAGDALENLVPQDLWPLPTYREMLFVR